MTPSPNPAVFVHNTKRIISVNDAGCALFRCERWELVDRDLLDFVPDYLKDLTRLRLYTTRQGKGTNVNPRVYDFVRCDGSVFVAEVKSVTREDRLIETTVTYRYDEY